MGVWVAAQLAWPDLAFDGGWSSFGRLRPTHTTGVIFGFGGNALIATSFHVVQRTSRARLAGQLSPWFVLLGYNLFCILAVTGYFMGVTQSKEYAEAEWYADLWLVIVWVTYFVLFIRTHRAAQGAAHLRRQLVLSWRSSSWWRSFTSSTTWPSRSRGAKPRATRSGPACRMRWCSGGTATMPLPSSSPPASWHAVLLPAGAGAAPDLLLPAVDPQLLGHHLLLHVGGFASPALHGAAALGADPGHDVLGDAARPVMGIGRQRAADPQRRLAQGPGRRDPALHDGGGGLLRTVDLRGLVPGDPAGQLALPLYRLDRRPRACRRARLGRAHHLRVDLHAGSRRSGIASACIRRRWWRSTSGWRSPGR